MPNENNHLKSPELTDDEFAKLYLEHMERYRSERGWWIKVTPTCDGCSKDISTPSEMRRMEGHSFHPSCFNKYWELHKGEYKKDDRNLLYFNRVAKLDLSRLV